VGGDDELMFLVHISLKYLEELSDGPGMEKTLWLVY